MEIRRYHDAIVYIVESGGLDKALARFDRTGKKSIAVAFAQRVRRHNLIQAEAFRVQGFGIKETCRALNKGKAMICKRKGKVVFR